MPIYRNDSNQQHAMETWAGHLKIVNPGDTIETKKYYSISGVTKISDSPCYNRVVARHSVEASAGGVAVPISLSTARVLVERITGTISVYRQTIANVPAELADRTAYDLIAIIPADGLYDQLVVEGTGTCDVVEYAE